ncbi:hypothetical protein ACOCG7_33845 (plasmid) [Paraburkholderia sp. DD10]|uniref:hypothetical protein n=1 Tax=Paraburkholderia sp. DD10 TaxID=3409691 RepID=UPI003BA06DA8
MNMPTRLSNHVSTLLSASGKRFPSPLTSALNLRGWKKQCSNAGNIHLLQQTTVLPNAVDPGELVRLQAMSTAAVSDRTTPNQLYDYLEATLALHGVQRGEQRPTYGPMCDGDIRHSQASVGKAERLPGYADAIPLAQGFAAAMPWYVRFVAQRNGQGLTR